MEQKETNLKLGVISSPKIEHNQVYLKVFRPFSFRWKVLSLVIFELFTSDQCFWPCNQVTQSFPEHTSLELLLICCFYKLLISIRNKTFTFFYTFPPQLVIFSACKHPLPSNCHPDYEALFESYSNFSVPMVTQNSCIKSFRQNTFENWTPYLRWYLRFVAPYLVQICFLTSWISLWPHFPSSTRHDLSSFLWDFDDYPSLRHLEVDC